MMTRRIYRRPSFRRSRRRGKFQWARFYSSANAPASPYTLDLLADYRLQFGLLMNPADLVLWRLHMKLSVVYTASALNAQTGISFAICNESIAAGVPNQLLQPYSERWLMWDEFYATNQFMESASIATPVAYREYDIRSHRKLQNQEESFWASVILTGNATALTTVSMTYSMLLRLP